MFRKYPQLQPATMVEALFVETKDQNGRPCLAIKLKAALPKRKAPVDPDEAAQKKAEREERKRKRKEAAEAAAAARLSEKQK